jgi:hypothetical protein
MLVHICMFKVLLLLFLCKGQELFSTFTEDDILNMTKSELTNYFSLANYLAYVATVGASVMVQTYPRIDIEGTFSVVVNTVKLLTEHEVLQCVKRKK